MKDNQELTSKELDAQVAEIMQLESSYEYAKLEPLKIIELVSNMDKRAKILIAGVRKAMEVLEDTAPDTIWMGSFNETMWEHLASIIDFEAEKQQELPLEDTALKQLTATQQKLDVAVEALGLISKDGSKVGYGGEEVWGTFLNECQMYKTAKEALNTIGK